MATMPGLLGHGNFGPCLVWNDPVSNFASPSYYMQRMLFSDNQGTHVLPLIQNTVPGFWSCIRDTASGRNDVLLKVANKSDSTEK